MFWKNKSKHDEILLRNNRFAVAYGIIHNTLPNGEEIGDFKAYMSDPRVVAQIEAQYGEARKILRGSDVDDFFASIILQLVDFIKSKSDLNELVQIAWSFNVARDVIFAYAPAIAEAGKLNVEAIARSMIEVIMDEISRSEDAKVFEPSLLPLRGVLAAYEQVIDSR